MINKAIIVGNLGADPEVRYTQSGTTVCTMNVATTEYKKQDNGDKQEMTEWHRIVAWAGLADNCSEYLHKGSKIYIEGRIQTRKWQDQNGNDRYTTEIIARDIKFLDSRNGNQGGNQGGRSQAPQQNNQAPQQNNSGQGGNPGFNQDNPYPTDDVPF